MTSGRTHRPTSEHVAGFAAVSAPSAWRPLARTDQMPRTTGGRASPGG